MRNNPPRLNVDISEEQDKLLRDLIPWGQKHHLFSAIVDELIKLLQEHGEMAISAIVCRRIKLIDIMKSKENT